jgi:hypothetical protein
MRNTANNFSTQAAIKKIQSSSASKITLPNKNNKVIPFSKVKFNTFKIKQNEEKFAGTSSSMPKPPLAKTKVTQSTNF